MAILNLAEEKARTNRSVGNVQTEYSLPWINGLRANVNVGFDITKADRKNFAPSILHRQTVGAPGGGRQTRFRPNR